jgi:hypothetical protein
MSQYLFIYNYAYTFINCLLFFSPNFSSLENFHFFLFFLLLFLPFLFLLSFLLFFLTNNTARRQQSLTSKPNRAATSALSARSPSPWRPPPAATLAMPPSPLPPPFLSSKAPWPAMELPLWPWLPSHGESQSSSFFFVGWPKRVHMTFLLSPRILWDFIFQLNSDFISNSNLNPPPRITVPISRQNRILAANRVPPRRRCFSPSPPLFHSPPFKLNHVPVVRSQGPNNRRKNYVKT